MFNKLLKGLRNPRRALSYVYLKSYYLHVHPLIFSGPVECPSCGWKGKNFFPFGAKSRNNALCPKCGSLERHRLYYLFLKKHIPNNKKLKVLHFAPNKCITNLFKSYKNVDYVSADIDPTKAMKKEDISDISFPDNNFDIVFVSHVLEHIENDFKAMQEIRRILKLDGFAVLQVPINDKLDQTYENPSITTPECREKHFGQNDHVRIYGLDYSNRLKKAGFKVELINFVDDLAKETVKKYALLPSGDEINETEGWIYVCTK